MRAASGRKSGRPKGTDRRERERGYIGANVWIRLPSGLRWGEKTAKEKLRKKGVCGLQCGP